VQTKAEQAKREIENFQYHNNKRIKMMQQSHQREVDALLLALQSETMKIENKANTETVRNSALKKQVATAQDEVAVRQ
jgi:hypothetical protein